MLLPFCRNAIRSVRPLMPTAWDNASDTTLLCDQFSGAAAP